jgi:hypothetical protein
LLAIFSLIAFSVGTLESEFEAKVPSVENSVMVAPAASVRFLQKTLNHFFKLVPIAPSPFALGTNDLVAIYLPRYDIGWMLPCKSSSNCDDVVGLRVGIKSPFPSTSKKSPPPVPEGP